MSHPQTDMGLPGPEERSPPATASMADMLGQQQQSAVDLGMFNDFNPQTSVDPSGSGAGSRRASNAMFLPHGTGLAHPGSEQRAPAPGLISDFPAHTNNMFHQQQSPAAGPAASSPISPSDPSTSHHHSSPSSSMLATRPSFSTTSTSSSSLAGALGPTQLNTPPSDSSTSPLGHGDHGWPSQSGTPASSPDMTRQSYQSQANSNSNMLSAVNLLDNIAHTAVSASRSCTEGQAFIATNQVARLAHAVSMVTAMFKELGMDPKQVMEQYGISANASTSTLPPTLPSSVPLSPPQGTSMEGILSMNNVLSGQPDLLRADSGDHGRKRCASTANDERSHKAIKLEPTSDMSLNTASSSAMVTPMGQYTPPETDLNMNIPLSADAAMGSFGLPSMSHFGFQHTVPPSMPHNSVLQSMPIPPVQSDFVLTRRNTWSERPPTLQHRHTHSVGDGVGNAMALNAINPISHVSNVQPPFTAAGSYGPPPIAPLSAGPDIIPPGHPRSTRSLSVTHNYKPSPFAYGMGPTDTLDTLAATSNYDPEAMALYVPTPEEYAITSSPEEDSEDYGSSGGHSPTRGRGEAGWPSSASGAPSRMSSRSRPDAIANEIPPEYRTEVDRIFFSFLERICSDLDATDAKGELIHQTLMAKKMQRLDESPDYRPFKFRIQAFTNAFLEELSQRGYPEEILPMKKVRHYLWNNMYISRYNEEGKKTKSKGNHIWSIDAKKLNDNTWKFRAFRRRLAGQPPAIAYIGLRWSWTPRIWDPQNARPNLPVQYGSPSLPPWLSWKDDCLSGTPNSDAESCEVIVNATFVQDGVEERLSQKVQIHVSAMGGIDGNVPSLRRPSLTSMNETGDPRRIASETTVSQAVSTRIPGSRPISGLITKASPTSTDAQVVQVLEQAAERVIQSQGEAYALGGVSSHDLNSLEAQRDVLQYTAQVYGEVTGQTQPTVAQTTPVVAVADAAKQMVYEAAQVVVAKKEVNVAVQKSVGLMHPNAVSAPVTVNEVSREAQTAVAQAIEIMGGSSQVQVLMTARSLLQQEGQATVATVNVNNAIRSATTAHALTPPAHSNLNQGSFSSSSMGMSSMGVHPPGFIAMS